MWLDWLVFCDYGFIVSSLWCPLATSTVLLGFLSPWTWGISSWLLQQSTVTAPYFGRRVNPYCHPSGPWMWNSSLGPLAPTQQPFLGHGGCSSWPLPLAPPLTLNVGYLLSAAPALSQPGTLSHRLWPRTWGSSSWPRSVSGHSHPRSEVCLKS